MKKKTLSGKAFFFPYILYGHFLPYRSRVESVSCEPVTGTGLCARIVVTSARPPFCLSSQQQIIQRHAPRRQITFCGCSNFPCQINPHSKSTDIILYSTACGVCPMSIPCLLALILGVFGVWMDVVLTLIKLRFGERMN